MRYNLESTLPIHAFQPLGGRHNPFKQRMTLEGGGGGIVSSIGDAIGGAVQGIGDAIGGAAEGVGSALASVDDFVGDTIPGGWGTVAAVAVPYAAPMLTGAALTLGQAAALAAGTSAATGAIQGKPLDQIALNAALAGGLSYGLGSLGEVGTESLALPSETPYVDLLDEGTLLNVASPSYYESLSLPSEMSYVDMPDGEFLFPSSAPSYDASSIGLPSETPYVDLPDGEVLLTPDSAYAPSVPAELSLDAFYQDMPDGINQLSYDPVSQETIAASNIPTITKDEEAFEQLIRKAQDTNIGSNVSYNPDTGVKITDFSTPASEETERMVAMGMFDRAAELPGAAYDMAKSYVLENPYKSAALGIGALTLLGGSDQQPQGSPSGSGSGSYGDSSSGYSGGYGSAGNRYDPYILRNRVNAENVYRYRNPYPSYAEGGEVKRFGLGGLSRAATRLTQPIEKAIIRPIGNAAPFLRDVAPYAGLIAAPFIASPFAAAGVGALSSGFGNPGSGFNMKRAMMGGIAAYGLSNIGAGVEAAGTTAAGAGTGTGFTSGAVDAALSNPDTVSSGFFRNPDAMAAGVRNLAGGSTYAPAAAQFATKAGIPSAGMAIMGGSGMMAIDEGIKQQAAYDAAAAATQGEQQDFLNRIAAGKKRAEQAVRENPYQYAMGGSVDDESGMDEARGMMQGNLQKGLFGQGYAAGGMPNLALSRLSQPAFNEGAVGGMQQFAAGGSPRFLSGGGDGMSDSIKASIEGNQEARLADGEFVIPADVVSHLGNGSSKAGAKQLYSMMDRVRQARVGTKKQGRAIKPRKLMPA
jgi:hypothetical protein